MADDLNLIHQQIVDLTGAISEMRGEFRQFREGIGGSVNRFITKVDEHLDLDNERFAALERDKVERDVAEKSKDRKRGFLTQMTSGVAGAIAGGVVTLAAAILPPLFHR